jgi:fructan beta-fructosidase
MTPKTASVSRRTTAIRRRLASSAVPVLRICALVIAMLVATIAGARTPLAVSFRPQYHFSAAQNWINDPNGLLFLDGEYHLFYQYNPFGDRWGHMSWGHARSRDLVQWEELPVAIAEDPAYMIFSGSIVVDRDNSSGFGANGAVPLVAAYTGFQRGPAEIQNQQLAFSNDGARTWTKYSGNPVLDLGLRAFRDPKIFWYDAKQQWVMAAVLSDARKVAFFGSKDLKTWQHLSDFGPAGVADGPWECPDLFALPVADAPREVRWVLKVDVYKSPTAVGSGAQYFIGRFDGATFTPEPGSSAQPVDYGKDFYAAASWSNLPASDGRHLWIAWMNSHEYAQDTPTAPWRGMMTVPREVSLRRTAAGFELLQAPVSELARLRVHHRRRADLRLEDEHPTLLESRLAASSEIVAILKAGEADELGLEVRVGQREKTVIGYDVRAGRLFVDRSQSGRSDFSDKFAGRVFAPFALTDGCLKLHLLLDHSSVEVFAGNGERVFSEQIFPASGSLGLRAYAKGQGAQLRALDTWDLVPRGR